MSTRPCTFGAGYHPSMHDATRNGLRRTLVTVGAMSAAGAASPQLAWVDIDVRPAASRDAAIAYDEARGVTILFGGEGQISRGRRDTWEWNGARWRQLFPARAPSERSGHAMCFDARRNRIVLFGGFDFGMAAKVADTWEWDGTTWTPIATAVAPPARYGHAMVFDSFRDVVVLYGGFGDPLRFLDDTWLWDGTTWMQAVTPVSPPARPRTSMAFDSIRGRAVLFSGWGSTNDTWEWDGALWLAQSPSVAPNSRAQAPMAFDPIRGKTVLAGGLGSTDTWEWDGSTWTQRLPAHSAEATQGFGVYDTLRRVVMVYGYVQQNQAKSQMVFDGNDWRLSAPPHPTYRSLASLAFDAAGGGCLLFGGSQGAGETWRYAGGAWSQLSSATAPSARRGHASSHDRARGKTLLFGGASGSVLNDELWEWDGSQWSAATPALRPPARYLAAMAYDTMRRETVVFGGASETLNNTALGDCWAWNGAAWSTLPPGPSARYGAALAYDERAGRLILFGGVGGSFNSTFFSDTWGFDGTVWTELRPVSSPSERAYASVCYDEVHRRIRLFGGQTGTSPLQTTYYQDTWEWDGSTWRQLQPSPAPPPRSQAAMAFDRVTGSIVLFGGTSGTLDDTRELRGLVPPRVAAYGLGCAGVLGPLASAVREGTWPVLGQSFAFEVSRVPFAQPAFVTLGASRTLHGSLPLPFDLGLIGMPGCTLLASPEITVQAPADPQGIARFTFPVPNQRVLLGGEIHLQACAPDPAANGLGWISSNGVTARIGE